MLIFRPIRTFLASLPKQHIIMLAGFVFLMALGQLLGTPNNSRATFPFVSWNMYSYTPKLDAVEFYEYIGSTQEGDEVALQPARIFPPLVNARLHHLLLALIKGVQADPAAEPNPSDEALFPFQSALKSSPKLEFIRTALRGRPAYSKQEYGGLLDDMLKGMARAYNARHADAPIRVVQVYKCTRLISDGPNPPIDRRRFRKVEIKHAS